MEIDYNNNRGGGRSGRGSRGGDRWGRGRGVDGGNQRPQQYQNTGRGGGGGRGSRGGGVRGSPPQRGRRPPQYGDQRPQHMMGGRGRDGAQRPQRASQPMISRRGRGGGGEVRGPPPQRSSQPKPGMIIYFISLLFICVMSSFGPGYKMLKWLLEIGIEFVTRWCLSGTGNEGRDQYLANLDIKINVTIGRTNIKFLLNGVCP